MPPTTRARILDYLKNHQIASVRALSSALTTSGANIRHHLAVLEADGLIEFISLRREERGRPVQIYSLSRRVQGDGLDRLASAMGNVWLKKTTGAALEESLKSLALQMCGNDLP